MAAETHLTF